MRCFSFVALLLFALWQEPALRQEAQPTPQPTPIFNLPKPSATPLWLAVAPPAWAQSAAWWYQPPCPIYQRTRAWAAEEFEQMAAWEKINTASEPVLREYRDCVRFVAEVPPLVFEFYGTPDLRRVNAAGDTLLCFGSCAYMDTYYEKGMRPVAARQMPVRKSAIEQLNWPLILR